MENIQDEDVIYTVVRNTKDKSKIVLSSLGGIEIGPLQTVNLKGRFRNAQLADAAHEIYSLISTGHLVDESPGAEKRSEENKPAQAQVQDEMKQKMVENLIREISGTSSLSQLEDWMSHREPAVAEAAKVRFEQLEGKRDDAGEIIPGSEDEHAPSAEQTQVGANLLAGQTAGSVQRSAPQQAAPSQVPPAQVPPAAQAPIKTAPVLASPEGSPQTQG